VECAPGLKIFTTTILAASDRIGIILRQRHAHPVCVRERERERDGGGEGRRESCSRPQHPCILVSRISPFLYFGPSSHRAKANSLSRISERVFSMRRDAPKFVLISSDVLWRNVRACVRTRSRERWNSFH